VIIYSDDLVHQIIVDEKDYDLDGYVWHAQKGRHTYYAKRVVGVKRHTILMHRVIGERMGFDPRNKIDHRDRNGLNNSRENLREANNFQNGTNSKQLENNTTGYRGVTEDKRFGVFNVKIRIEGEQKNLGTFKTAIEAALRYDQAAIHYHGEFATLNFPRS
jgi:hypothetical protein